MSVQRVFCKLNLPSPLGEGGPAAQAAAIDDPTSISSEQPPNPCPQGMVQGMGATGNIFSHRGFKYLPVFSSRAACNLSLFQQPRAREMLAEKPVSATALNS